MKLNFNYFAGIRPTLYDPEYENSLEWMQKAGVDTLWLCVRSWGKPDGTPEEIAAAKAKLEAKGFAVNALILPVGHPGNALNPEDETLDLRLPESWTYRVKPNGEKQYFCGCINDVLIEDARRAVELCRDLGFEKVFFDDDLRMGNVGNEIRGCFCPECVREFSEIIGRTLSREEIARDCAARIGLADAWVDYICGKVTRFMKETAVKGIQTGIMVMYNGGRDHGIDIAAIREAVPDCLFRVGQYHFNDAAFEADEGHAGEIGSIREHLEQMGNINHCYSESTVFPPNALSPENLVKKVELAIREGIRNIFLMSGSWVMTEKYWKKLIENREFLRKLAAE